MKREILDRMPEWFHILRKALSEREDEPDEEQDKDAL